MTPKHGFDDLLIGFSVVAVLFATLGYFGYNIELASTQWMSVAIMLAIWGVYLKAGCSCRKK